MKSAVLLAACLIVAPAIARADAQIYEGTIGDKAVVVEFSDVPDAGNADLFGRYFYVDQGVDIPLHAIKGQRNRLGLAEEVACSAALDNCDQAEDNPPRPAPLGAKWDLTVSGDHKSIAGEFALDGRKLPVELSFTASREFDTSLDLPGLQEFAMSLWYSGETLTPETSPYDYLKVTSIKLTEGDPVELTGGSVRYVTDPRTKFQFPRIVSLDSGDAAAANDYLEQRHWMMTLDALYCVAQQYQGFGWNGYNYDAGTLGWWDEELVEVHYLTPSVLSWTEGGSLSCGGAHPYNHYEYMNLDVAAGTTLDLSRVFKGWIARDYDGNIADLDEARANPREYQWGPDDELLAFVNAHRPTNEELGFTGGEDDCPIDELIPQYLSISFMGDDVVAFSMDGLPHVAVACASALYDAPITELRELLTDEAATYFPVLGD